MNIHKNARLTLQGRVLLVRRITEEGWRIVDAANAAGISERQSYRWLARYRSGGGPAHRRTATTRRHVLDRAGRTRSTMARAPPRSRSGAGGRG